MDKQTCLSFYVEEISERVMVLGPKMITVFQTKLKHYTSGETITIRGKPWKLGTKLDFHEIDKQQT